jgi:hypothetical protein
MEDTSTTLETKKRPHLKKERKLYWRHGVRADGKWVDNPTTCPREEKSIDVNLHLVVKSMVFGVVPQKTWWSITPIEC